MSVEGREITCYEYINTLRDIAKYSGQGIYGLDNNRTKLHNKLCCQFSLDKKLTKQITNNLEIEDERCAEDLYLKLLELTRLPKELEENG